MIRALQLSLQAIAYTKVSSVHIMLRTSLPSNQVSNDLSDTLCTTPNKAKSDTLSSCTSSLHCAHTINNLIAR